MPPPLRKLFREKIQKEVDSIDRWVDRFPATIGKADGTILTSTSGIIWVQNVITGQEEEVHNTIAPINRLGLHVIVGRYPGEILLRIKEVATVYAIPASTGETTEAIVQSQFIDRDHFLPFLVAPIDGGGFVVDIFGDTFIRSDGTIGAIAKQTFDLSSHVPAAGALYVVIEADDDGIIYATDGVPVDSKEILTLADIPPITPNRRSSCAVRLYDGQVQLYRDPETVLDFVDLRSLTSNSAGNDIVYVRKFTDQLAAPTVDDDIDAGYLITDIWVYNNGYTSEAYICRDNAVSAADWLQLGTGGSGEWGAITGALSDQTDLQSALDGKSDISEPIATAHISDATAAHAATAIANTPAGGISATTVQAALDELDNDKVIRTATSTDNAVARFNGTAGSAIQNSLMTVDDSGSPNIPTGQTYKINGSSHAHSATFNDAEGDPEPIGATDPGASSYPARRDHVHAMDQGSAVLGSTFTITGAAGTYQDTGLFVTLPSAGTYRITANVRGRLQGNAGTTWFIQAELYNATDTAAVTDSETLVVLTNTTGALLQMTAPIDIIVTVAASKVINLYAARNGTGTPSWTLSTISSDSGGKTRLMYEKIG